MKLNGVDVYGGDGKNILSKIDYDFAIVKMSGNPQDYDWDYVNPYAKKQADDCMKKTGLLGLYHFTWGKSNPETEADFFIEQVKKIGYLGKSMLCIDYEAQAVKNGRKWVKGFADRIMEKTGQIPVIYASSSVIRSQKLGDLGYPIWCANYYKGYDRINGYDTSGCKIGYDNSLIWQFTSSGRLKGHSGNLDLNIFYGTKDDFKKYMGVVKKKESNPETKPAKKKKTIEQLAKEVIAGKWGNGDVRKEKLEEAGYNYSTVQARVNKIIAQTLSKVVRVGCKVKVKAGANQYGRTKGFSSFVYKDTFKVVEVRGNRVVIADKDCVIGAIAKGDCIVQ